MGYGGWFDECYVGFSWSTKSGGDMPFQSYLLLSIKCPAMIFVFGRIIWITKFLHMESLEWCLVNQRLSSNLLIYGIALLHRRVDVLGIDQEA